MRRTITKEIPVTNVKATVYDIETENVYERVYQIIGKYRNDAALNKALNAVVEPTVRILCIRDILSLVKVCCMSLETFLEHSTVEVSREANRDETADGNEDD